MALHPRLPTHPFIITDLPTNEAELRDFLELLGDLHTWNKFLITSVLRTNSPRDLILSRDNITFLRTVASTHPDYTHYTALQMRQLLLAPLYRRS